MVNRNRKRRSPLAAIVALLVSGLLAGCGSDPTTSNLPAERLATPASATQLLPTPTLAAPILTDPLRPPTPIVMPSPTSPAAGETERVPDAGESIIDAALSPTVASQPSPTASLPEGATSEELITLGRLSAAEGDQSTAAAAFAAVVDQPGDLSAEFIAEAHLGLAIALMALGQYDVAALGFETLIQDPQSLTRSGQKGGTLVAAAPLADVAAFHLGQARLAMGDHSGAIEAFSAYLQNHPDMAAYIQPLIADSQEVLGNTNGVIAALEVATEAPAQRFKAVANRSRLAALFLANGDYAAAIAQYDAIHDIARTEATKGQMTFLAGQAELMAGNTASAHDRFQKAITEYPRSTESYHALVALIEAGVKVDEYQRGVVDYYAGVYQPAVEAFQRYLAAPPKEYNTDAHVFLAWSHEKLGEIDAALAELETLEEVDPARALFERGEVFRRAGRSAEALAAFDELLTTYPEMEGAAGVAWTAAGLADSLGHPGTTERYLYLADTFPFDPNTPPAIFRAAELAEAAGDQEQAGFLRQRLIEQYPANIDAAETLFRLLQAAQSDQAEGLDQAALAEQVETLSLTNYFALRAADFVASVAPFTAEGEMVLPGDPDAGRAEAETWLRERLVARGENVPAGELGALSPELADNPNRVVGEKLWQLGLLEEAKAELETVREANADNPVANYQLARYFSELGLYRSSIIAAAALLQQTGTTIFDAPHYIGRLSYPAYYSDLIIPLADDYGFDPRLQFALVRQESLFESFARSGAAAQGLSQVIPDTGAWIAQRLGWTDFINEDLYKPYVGLQFGAYYLSEQLGNFDGHVHAALAAYNGGPGNAARWFELAGADHDRFVDTVDFPETRLYIERIYEGFNAYRHLYRQP